MRSSAVEPSTAPPKSAVASGTHMTETTLGPAEAIHYRVKLELPLNLATQKQAPPVTPTVPQEQGRNRDLNFKLIFNFSGGLISDFETKSPTRSPVTFNLKSK